MPFEFCSNCSFRGLGTELGDCVYCGICSYGVFSDEVIYYE